VLEDIAEPEPGPHDLGVRVEAAVVNLADILVCAGTYQDRPGVPLTPGLECCAVVESAPPGSAFGPGARIVGMTSLPSGAFAEAALMRAATAIEMPAELPATDAAVLHGTFLTAHLGLHRRAGLGAGEWLLVHGAAGGVGSAAVQLGVVAGARVIAVVSGAGKAGYCTELGAEHVVDLRRDDLFEEVGAITSGLGVDVAFDPVGGSAGDETRRLMAWEGRLVVVGFASGVSGSFPANHLLLKNYSVVGVHMGIYGERGRRAALLTARDELLDMYRAGEIRVDVSGVVGLDGVPDALAALERREVTGRLVLVP
jgi:NADPH2:quinone reductase